MTTPNIWKNSAARRFQGDGPFRHPTSEAPGAAVALTLPTAVVICVSAVAADKPPAAAASDGIDSRPGSPAASAWPGASVGNVSVPVVSEPAITPEGGCAAGGADCTVECTAECIGDGPGPGKASSLCLVEASVPSDALDGSPGARLARGLDDLFKRANKPVAGAGSAFNVSATGPSAADAAADDAGGNDTGDKDLSWEARSTEGGRDLARNGKEGKNERRLVMRRSEAKVPILAAVLMGILAIYNASEVEDAGGDELSSSVNDCKAGAAVDEL